MWQACFKDVIMGDSGTPMHEVVHRMNCFLFIVVEVETNRLTTVLQENAVLRSELEVMRLRCKNLMEENRRLRQASVTIVSMINVLGGRPA